MREGQQLASIRVLYRQSDSLSLWGIPYGMRPGQNPRDLRRGYDRCLETHEYHQRHGLVQPRPRDPTEDWIWLGTPGWFGNMNAEQVAEVKTFLEAHRDELPQWPEEWIAI